MALHRGTPDGLAPLAPERHEGIDRTGMEPVRPQIDRMTAQGDRHGAAADPVACLEHHDADPAAARRRAAAIPAAPAPITATSGADGGSARRGRIEDVQVTGAIMTGAGRDRSP
jgi:hypothetical protein